MNINFLVLLCILAIAFIAGALSVHAYPAFDWKVGDVHDWLRKRVLIVHSWIDAVKAWFAAKKSRV